MVNEYRTKYNKAVIYSADSYDNYGWAVFMAGGSLAVVPAVADPKFAIDASAMKAIELNGKPQGQFALGNPEKGYIVYSASADAIHLNLATGNYLVTLDKS